MDASYCDLTHGTGTKEVDGIEDRSNEVQAYAGLIGPVGCRCGVSQKEIEYGSNDKNGDESAKLPLQQGQRDGLAPQEAHQFVHHQPEAIEVAQIGKIEEEACAIYPRTDTSVGGYKDV